MALLGDPKCKLLFGIETLLAGLLHNQYLTWFGKILELSEKNEVFVYLFACITLPRRRMAATVLMTSGAAQRAVKNSEVCKI